MPTETKTCSASVDDAWRAVEGDELAHLFPVGGRECLCGRFAAGRAGQRATCMTQTKRHPVPAGMVRRRYCGECLEKQLKRWG